MSWPSTADGDVFRRLQSSKFDFSFVHEIDFNVDFDSWPPPSEAIRWLEHEFKNVHVHQPQSGDSGYIEFKIANRLTYDLVVSTQERVSKEMAKHGGVCESWGVLQAP